MEITKKENQKLLLAKQMFKVQELTKEQAEFTLGRKLTDRTWQQYTTSQKRKHKKIEDNVYSVKHLFVDVKKNYSHNSHSPMLQNMPQRKPRGNNHESKTTTSE